MAEPVQGLVKPGALTPAVSSRVSTLVTGALSGLGIVGAALGLSSAVTITSAIVFGMGAIVSSVNDLGVPSVRNRRSAESTLKCFAEALVRGKGSTIRLGPLPAPPTEAE